MSVITDTWRFLKERKLWPLAILLIVAAVAVPKLLASEPTAAPVPPAAVVKSDSASVLATEPIVAPAEDADRSGRRQVLGSRKNPFKPQATPTPDSQAEGDQPRGRGTHHRHDRHGAPRLPAAPTSVARRPPSPPPRRPRRSTSSTS